MRLLLSLLLLSASAQAATWPSAVVTYSDSTPRRFHASVDAAFAQWSAVIGVEFKKVESGADIEVQMYRDKDRFVYGQCCISTVEGRITHAKVFINSRAWACRYYVLPTVLHEIGHALGLGESTELCAMNGAYHAGELTAGDVKAAKGLYEK